MKEKDWKEMPKDLDLLDDSNCRWEHHLKYGYCIIVFGGVGESTRYILPKCVNMMIEEIVSLTVEGTLTNIHKALGITKYIV